jgi:serpin B
MPTRRLSCLLVLLLSPAVLRGQSTAPPAPPDAQVQKIVDGQTSLLTTLYARLRTEPGNLFFSPYSIDTALMMVYAGANGKTAREMAAVLHLPDDPPDQLHKAVGQLISQIQHADKDSGYQLNVANALWAQMGVHWLPAYLDLLHADYAAEAFAADFSRPDPARQSINDWVAQQTNQKITDLLPSGSITPLTRLVLVDAVYFKADWESPFHASDTHDGDFHPNAGSTVTVPMMHRTASFGFMDDEKIQALQMPYAGGRWAMLLVLPKTTDGLAAVEAKLDPGELNRIVSALSVQSVQVTIPKFKLSQNFSLGEMLESLGMSSAFDPNKADFSGMDGRRDLCLSDVVHKAYVAVDEKGTEAAAATGAVMRATAVMRPPQAVVFNADHPFMFFIRDPSSGLVLFAGRLSQPSQ